MNQLERLQEIITNLDIDALVNLNQQEKLNLISESKAIIEEAYEILDAMAYEIDNMSFIEYYKTVESYTDLKKLIEISSLPNLSLSKIVEILVQVRDYDKKGAVIENLN